MPQRTRRELKRDPLDGGMYTYQQVRSYYLQQYSTREIQLYWKHVCMPVSRTSGEENGDGASGEDNSDGARAKASASRIRVASAPIASPDELPAHRVLLEEGDTGEPRFGEFFRSLTVVWQGRQYHGSVAGDADLGPPHNALTSLFDHFQDGNDCSNWRDASGFVAEVQKLLPGADSPNFSLIVNSLEEPLVFTSFTSLKQLFNNCTLFGLDGVREREEVVDLALAAWPWKVSDVHSWRTVRVEGEAVPKSLRPAAAVADGTRVVAIGEAGRVFILETDPQMHWTAPTTKGNCPTSTDIQVCRVDRTMYVLSHGASASQGGGLYGLDLDTLSWRCVHSHERADSQTESPYYLRSSLFLAVGDTHVLKLGGCNDNFVEDSTSAWLFDSQTAGWNNVPVTGLHTVCDCTVCLGAVLLPSSQLALFMGFDLQCGSWASEVRTSSIDLTSLSHGGSLAFQTMAHEPFGFMQSNRLPACEGRYCAMSPTPGPGGECTVLICGGRCMGSYEVDDFLYAISFRECPTVAPTSSKFAWTGGYPTVGGRIPMGRSGHSFLEVDGKLVLFGGGEMYGEEETCTIIHVLERRQDIVITVDIMPTGAPGSTMSVACFQLSGDLLLNREIPNLEEEAIDNLKSVLAEHLGRPMTSLRLLLRDGSALPIDSSAEV